MRDCQNVYASWLICVEEVVGKSADGERADPAPPGWGAYQRIGAEKLRRGIDLPAEILRVPGISGFLEEGANFVKLLQSEPVQFDRLHLRSRALYCASASAMGIVSVSPERISCKRR